MTGPTNDAQAAAGLTSAEAAARLRELGPNELERRRATPAWRLLLVQFTSPLVLLLLGAAVLSGVLRQWVDATAIIVIVAINAAVGFYQEYRAEQALLALRSLTARRARVLRDGRTQVVPAADVVVGDMLVLQAGDVVAADARLCDAHALTTLEAPLTGESFPVDKRAEPPPADAPLAERHDHVFMGTAVATGSASAEVVATGMGTEMGRIAGMLATGGLPTTPLQRRLRTVGVILVYACVGLVAVVAVLGAIRGLPWLDILMTAITLAVAAVPEGLPAVVTIALAVGVRRMVARNALIRRLSSVETLGSATVICTDKTGTLTTGKMTVRDVWTDDRAELLACAAACTDAELGRGGEAQGDPTEIAILEAAAEAGISRWDIERDNPRRVVRPFDPMRRSMSIYRADGRLYVKGAVEVVLSMCDRGVEGADAACDAMANRALRVLAVAVGDGEDEAHLRLVGLLGIADTPRPEAIAAIHRAREAGIRVVMITGDHPLTAAAIAREMGIETAEDGAGRDVYARATPEDKTRIVRELQERGEIVAMTGDGVNDAPSVRAADIGIAMGVGATEVTREASDMVLTDDNLSTIVDAVREGRVIYDNIRKTIVYLLAGNSAELLLMLVASVIGLPLPLLPLHLLWINLMTEPLPALALVVDPPEGDVLTRPPRPPREPVLGRPQWGSIALVAVLQTIVALIAFWTTLQTRDLADARMMAFSTLVFGEVLRAFAARSRTRVLWEVGALGNLKLLLVVAICCALQLAVVSLPGTRTLFALGPFWLEGMAMAFGLGLVPVTVIEITKLVRRTLARALGRPGPQPASGGTNATGT